MYNCFNITSFREYFLSHGANINKKNSDVKTLHFAALNNNNKSMETFELHISHYAYINEKYYFGKPLFIMQYALMVKQQLRVITRCKNKLIR